LGGEEGVDEHDSLSEMTLTMSLVDSEAEEVGEDLEEVQGRGTMKTICLDEVEVVMAVSTYSRVLVCEQGSRLTHGVERF
jgi:hypothetical protein